MNNNTDIKYSIIIPTLNHSSKLKQCLFYLSELAFEPDLFEVLVIDNGSTDDTKEIDKIDFLFIDGDHHYEGVKKDWDLYSPLLKSGSIVDFHDTGWAE